MISVCFCIFTQYYFCIFVFHLPILKNLCTCMTNHFPSSILKLFEQNIYPSSHGSVTKVVTFQIQPFSISIILGERIHIWGDKFIHHFTTSAVKKNLQTLSFGSCQFALENDVKIWIKILPKSNKICAMVKSRVCLGMGDLPPLIGILIMGI